jgi:hypothetical protein
MFMHYMHTHTHAHTQPHQRTRNGIAVLAFILRKTEARWKCASCPAPRTLIEAHTRRRRKPSEAHLRMSGGKACGKQAAQYTGKQPDEGSVVTSRDTAAAENEVHLEEEDAHHEAIYADAARRLTPRTIMLRRISKRVKEVVDKMRLPLSA